MTAGCKNAGSVASKTTALEELYRRRGKLADLTVYYHELCLEPDALIERMRAAGVGDGSDFIRPVWRRRCDVSGVDAREYGAQRLTVCGGCRSA